MIRLAFILALLAAPALATQDAVPGLYAVRGVAADDVLNVRAEPNARSVVVGGLAPDATGIEVVATSDDLRWGQVNVDERSGWVALRFLANMPGEFQGRFPDPARCFGTEPFWSVEITDEALLFERIGESVARFGAGHRDAAIGRRDAWSVRAVSRGRGLVVVVGTASCGDGMSDRAYGLTADVILSTTTRHEHYAGCCSLTP